jgi:hypothetical protein
MADVVLSADDVGHVVQYLAPGFFARVAYEARFPQRERSSLSVLVWSVAASLPLVALGTALANLLGIRTDPTYWLFVVTLLVPSVAAGYIVACLRATGGCARLLVGWACDISPRVPCTRTRCSPCPATRRSHLN